MKYLKQFCLILAVSFAGELLHEVLPFPVPAGIYGIFLLFFLLQSGIVAVADIKEVSSFLITIMPVMFIPPAVGLIGSWSLVRASWGAYVIIAFISTLVVMAVSGVVAQFIVQKKEN